MAKQTVHDRKLTPAEAAKYRTIRAEIELEKPEIIAKAQQRGARLADNNWLRLWAS